MRLLLYVCEPGLPNSTLFPISHEQFWSAANFIWTTCISKDCCTLHKLYAWQSWSMAARYCRFSCRFNFGNWQIVSVPFLNTGGPISTLYAFWRTRLFSSLLLFCIYILNPVWCEIPPVSRILIFADCENNINNIFMSWPSHVCCKRANLSLLSYAQILFSYSQSAVVYACRRVRVSSCCVELVVCVVVLCYLATWAFLGLGKSIQISGCCFLVTNDCILLWNWHYVLVNVGPGCQVL